MSGFERRRGNSCGKAVKYIINLKRRRVPEYLPMELRSLCKCIEVYFKRKGGISCGTNSS